VLVKKWVIVASLASPPAGAIVSYIAGPRRTNLCSLGAKPDFLSEGMKMQKQIGKWLDPNSFDRTFGFNICY
jgi:hypothetical protein